MRPDHLNLILLFLLLLVAVCAVWKFHPSYSELRSKWKRQIGLGAAGFFLWIFLFLPSVITYCGNKQPIVHATVGVFAAASVFFGVRYGIRRILSVIAVTILAGISLSHYFSLVESGDFIGTTDMSSFDNHNEEEKYCSAEELWHTPITRLYRLHCKRLVTNEK
ncbi:hypothetical protein GCAAIG_00860 [Candidatus Electronema halotolerans]